MIETLWHAGCWFVLGLACLYAGSEPRRATQEISARDVYFPADTGTEP